MTTTARTIAREAATFPCDTSTLFGTEAIPSVAVLSPLTLILLRSPSSPYRPHEKLSGLIVSSGLTEAAPGNPLEVTAARTVNA